MKHRTRLARFFLYTEKVQYLFTFSQAQTSLRGGLIIISISSPVSLQSSRLYNILKSLEKLYAVVGTKYVSSSLGIYINQVRPRAH